MKENKKQYRQMELSICLLEQDDVVRTSGDLEVDYQQQSWGSGDTGFDKPFN